jgi:hypothetical protein
MRGVHFCWAMVRRHDRTWRAASRVTPSATALPATPRWEADASILTAQGSMGPHCDGKILRCARLAMGLRFQNLLLRKNFIPISHRLHRVDISLISQLQNHLEVT